MTSPPEPPNPKPLKPQNPPKPQDMLLPGVAWRLPDKGPPKMQEGLGWLRVYLDRKEPAFLGQLIMISLFI